jgi:hypothetical protein
MNPNVDPWCILKKHGKTTTCFDQPRFKKLNHSIKPWRSNKLLNQEIYGLHPKR